MELKRNHKYKNCQHSMDYREVLTGTRKRQKYVEIHYNNSQLCYVMISYVICAQLIET